MNTKKRKNIIGNLYQINSVSGETPFPRFNQVVDGKVAVLVSFNTLEQIDPDSILMLIAKLNLTPETITQVGSTRPSDTRPSDCTTLIADISLQTKQEDNGMFSTIWNFWKEKRRISGYVFLTPGGQYVWVSCFDFDNFKEVTNNL